MVDIYMPAGVKADIPTSTAEFKPGQCAYGSDGREFVYVQSSGALTQYDCVAIDEDFIARPITTTLGAEANSVGFAQVAFTDGQFGWVATKGHDAGVDSLKVRTKDNTAANAALYTSTSAGVLSSDGSTGNPVRVEGVRTADAAPSGGGATAIVATYPHLGLPAA
mgnify:CR=1 FL=1